MGLVALTLVVLYFVTMWLLLHASISIFGCGAVFTIDEFGCTLVAALLVVYIPLVSAAALSVPLLRALVFEKWSDATLFALPVMLVILAEGWRLQFSVRLLGVVVAVVVVGGLLYATAALYWLLRGRAKSIAFVLSLLLAIGICAALPALQYTYSTRTAEPTKKAAQIPFVVLQPGYIGPDFRVVQHAASTNDVSFYETDYVNDTSKKQFSLYQIVKPSSYAPPQACGPQHPAMQYPGPDTQSCHLLGHSDLGCDVYVTDLPSSATKNTFETPNVYCALPDSLLVLTASYGPTGVFPDLSSSMLVFHSLRSASPNEVSPAGTRP